MEGISKYLTKSEDELMELFWIKNKPLTSVEILKIDSNNAWNGNYLHIMLRSLLKKGMLEVCGTVQYGTQYARQFIPLITKEEYAAKIVMSKGVKKSSIAKVAVAMVKEANKDEKEANKDGKDDIIKQLEEIIEELKENKTKEE